MKKFRIVTGIIIVLMFSALLSGCEEHEEKILYNKLITNGTFVSLEDKYQGKATYYYLNIKPINSEKPVTLQLDYDTYNSLVNYTKYKKNIDTKNDIKLNVVYNSSNNEAYGVTPVADTK